MRVGNKAAGGNGEARMRVWGQLNLLDGQGRRYQPGGASPETGRKRVASAVALREMW